MSFDTTGKKIGLQEAAAKYFIIRDSEFTNDRLDNFSQTEVAVTAYLLQALCQVSTLSHFNTHCRHFPSLKDEPFTREKLKIF